MMNSQMEIQHLNMNFGKLGLLKQKLEKDL